MTEPAVPRPSGRGGAQRLPRPPEVRPGPDAPWVGLGPQARRIGLDEVRAVCAALPPPRSVGEGFPELVPPEVREAAVLLPLFQEVGEARVVLTRRPESMPSHQGEIAFPGGGRRSSDPSLEDTALREAEEEIGLDPHDVEVVGRLDQLGPTVSGFLIAPFVGLLAARPVLRPDPREVDRVLDVALSELLAPGVHREELWLFEGRPRAIHLFELDDETVWGATARILVAFLAAIVAGRRGVAG